MRKRPLLLDLFCGAGGCAVGYHRAGFDVVGVDIKPQKNYPFEFVQADALNPPFDLKDFDAIHASPPCQAYSRALRHLADKKPALINYVRSLLAASGIPYVIENVIGAPLHNPAMVCGTSLQLPLRRHRIFECSFSAKSTACRHRESDMNPHRASSRKKIGYAPERQYRDAMGVSWMSKQEARQAIPPAYTEYIGKQLLEVVQRRQTPTVGGET